MRRHIDTLPKAARGWLSGLRDPQEVGAALVLMHNIGTWSGWRPSQQNSIRTDLPFQFEPYKSRHGGEDLGVLYERFKRDGFLRLGENRGKRQKLAGPKYQVACHDDDGWNCRPSRLPPQLKVRYISYLTHGYRFTLSLEGFPELLNGASWASWNSTGNLWVARPGMVEKFTLKDLNA